MEDTEPEEMLRRIRVLEKAASKAALIPAKGDWTTASTGILSGGVDSAGFIEMMVGGRKVYVPYFTKVE